jgi:hypothetical protein
MLVEIPRGGGQRAAFTTLFVVSLVLAGVGGVGFYRTRQRRS